MEKYELSVGFSFVYPFVFTEDQVRLFAEATGDHNPLHLDREYCRGTQFNRPIVHGLLSASVFSKVFGMIFPGVGTLYVSQTLEFKKPIYPNNKYEARFQINSLDKERGFLEISCLIVDDEEIPCLQGQSKLLNRKIFR